MVQDEIAPPRDVAELWRERFGQPPPIVAEPELMLAILERTPAQEVRSWAEAE